MKHLIYNVAIALCLLLVPAIAVAQSDDCKQTYKVEKKDNLIRIAQNHGVSVEELLKANPKVNPDKRLKKGTLLCIPYTAAEREAQRLEAERLAREKAEAERRAYLSVPHPIGELHVACVLPFKEDKRATRMLEFYSGMMLAADSVEREGKTVKISAFHSGTTEAEMNNIIASGKLDHMNLIIGPVDEPQAAPLADFCRERGIRLVMPFATTGQVGLTNPLTYIVTDDQDDVQQRAARQAHALFPHANYIFVAAPNSDERGRNYVAALRALTGGATVENILLTAPTEEFAAALKADRQNVVVMNSIRESNLTKLLAKLDAAKGTHRVSLLGYPDYLAFSAKTETSLYRYDTHVYSNFYRNPSQRATQRVEAQYKRKFGKTMAETTPRFGLLGFDLGYYFIHGITAQGESFETIQHELRYNYLQHRFDFQHAAPDAGFINRHVFMVRFKPSRQIELR